MAADSGGNYTGAELGGDRPSLSEFLAHRQLAKFAAAFESDEVDLDTFVLLKGEEMKRFATSASDQVLLEKAIQQARLDFPELAMRDQRENSFDSNASDGVDLSSTLPKNFKFERHGGKPSSLQSHKYSAVQRAHRDSGLGPDDRGASSSNLLAMQKLGSSEPNLAPDPSSKIAASNENSGVLSRKRSVKTRTARPRSMIFPTDSSERLIGGPQSPEHCISPLPLSAAQALQANRSLASRRWSFASSVPSCSSGYDSSSPASWSSHERLHQLPQRPTSDEIQGLISLFGTSAEEGDDPYHRSRSRSLSPSRGSYLFMDMTALNQVFRDRFPKAKEQMEEKLNEFLVEAEAEIASDHHDGAFNFVVHQLEEIARNLFTQSKLGNMSSELFRDATSSLDRLYSELCVRRDSSEGTHIGIHKLLHHLLSIFARPARLLECLEFDADSFYHGQPSTDVQTDMNEKLSTLTSTYHVPRYIQHRLRQLEEGVGTDDPSRSLSPINLSRSGSPTPELECEKEELPKGDDFDEVKLISQGAYSSVHLVRHHQSKKIFAMKKVSKLNMIRKKQVEQVFCERDILTFAENPFVVAMICTFETKKHLCMVLEYVEGGDCATLLKNMQGALPLELARLYFGETVLALEYLHSYGIVHRDLKPDNMLITSEGHIKLTDFGLSKVGLMRYATTIYEGGLGKATTFNDEQVYGTPDYIAPEVILRKGYGTPVDWWAMGIILYEFLVGITPFYGEGVDELFEQITNEEVEAEFSADMGISDEAQDIIFNLLKRNPSDRLGSHAFVGADEVKAHPFFDQINWRSLLLQKAEFVPHLDNEEDTSYFDTRADRYNHTLEDDEEVDGLEAALTNSFQGFTTTSPRYQQISSPMGSRHASTSELSELGLDSPSPRRLSRMKRKPSFSSNTLSPLSHPVAEAQELEKETDSPTEATPSTPEVHVEPATPSETPLFVSPATSTSPSPVPSTGRAKLTGKKPANLSLEKHDDIFNTPSNNDPKCSFVPESPKPAAPTSTTSSKTASVMAEMASGLWAIGMPRNPQSTTYTVEKGPQGFGMALRSVRVYLGDTDKYCMQHLVRDVDAGSPAWKAGVRPDHLLTQIDSVPVAGLKHTDVMLLLGGGKTHTFQMVHLNETTISTGGRKRMASMSRRVSSKQESELKKLLRTGSLSRRTKGFFSRRNSRKQRKESNSSRSGSPSNRSGSPGPLSPQNSLASQPSPTLARGVTSTLSRLARKIRPDRRRSVSSMPVSPLARGPSPAGSTVGSPTSNSPPLQRASSPHVHSVAPNLASQHSPLRKTMSASGVPSNLAPLHPSHRTSPTSTALDVPCSSSSGVRSGSPLLRRALSPDHGNSPPDAASSSVFLTPEQPKALSSPKRSLRPSATVSALSPSRKVQKVAERRISLDEKPTWSDRTRQFDNL